MQVSVYFTRWATPCAHCNDVVQVGQLNVTISGMIKSKVYHYLCFMQWAKEEYAEANSGVVDDGVVVLVPDLVREGVFWAKTRERYYKETETGWEETLLL